MTALRNATLGQLLDETARLHPDTEAVVYVDRDFRLTYGQFKELVDEMAKGLMALGVQKGDRCDVEVRIPSKSETASLRGGWLMRARLREMAVLDNALHTGHVEGLAEGHVLVDAIFDGNTDKVR